MECQIALSSVRISISISVNIEQVKVLHIIVPDITLESLKLEHNIIHRGSLARGKLGHIEDDPLEFLLPLRIVPVDLDNSRRRLVPGSCYTHGLADEWTED